MVITKDSIVEALSNTKEFANITKKDMKAIIDTVFNTIRVQVLTKGNTVSISDFGKFISVTREGITKGFGKEFKYKSKRLILKPFKASKVKIK